MKFISQNIAIIVSLALAYAIIHFTVDYWPGVIHALSGAQLEVADITKYKFPVVILAFILFPITRELKKKLNL